MTIDIRQNTLPDSVNGFSVDWYVLDEGCLADSKAYHLMSQKIMSGEERLCDM